jgi:nucleoside-diphosphate-sugar epimerase
MNNSEINILIKNIAFALENKTIFLTGGTGFFGRSFLEFIIGINSVHNLNLKIYVLARDPERFKNKYPQLIENFITFQKGDIVNFDFLDIKVNYIFHFATPASATMNIENPIGMFDNIVDGSRRILDFAVKSKCEKFLLTSSGAVYGKQPTELTHIPESYMAAPTTQNSHSAYGEGKRVAELMGNIYSSKYGFEHKIARCFAFVGPHLDANGTFAIGNFIRDAIQGKTLSIGGDGTPFRSYLYSSDLIVWLLTILLTGKSNQPYNVGSDNDLSISDLAKKVTQLINPSLRIEIAKKATDLSRPDRYVPNVSLAKNELGLCAWTPLDDSIIKTAAVYKQLLLNKN